MKSKRKGQIQVFIRNKAGLAGRVGLAKSKLEGYLSLDGAPKKTKRGWPLVAVTEFVRANLTNETKIAQHNPSMANAKLEEVEIRLRRARRAEQIEMGTLISLDDLASDVRQSLEKIKQGLLSLPSQWAARFGAIGPEIEKVSKEDITGMLRTLAEDFGRLGK